MPRAWLLSLLPTAWATQLPRLLTMGACTVLDVSFSMAAINLLPLPLLDGHHATPHLLRPFTSNPVRAHKALSLAAGVLGVWNAMMAVMSLMTQDDPPVMAAASPRVSTAA